MQAAVRPNDAILRLDGSSLMRMLDLSEQTNYSGLFSDNIGSLGSSLNAIESVSVAVEESPLAQRQFVVYRLAP